MIAELAYRLEDECETQVMHVCGAEARIRKGDKEWHKLGGDFARLRDPFEI